MFPIHVSVPTRFPALVTYALIAVNVVVFLSQLGLSERAGEVAAFTYGLVPARYSHWEWALRVGLNPNDYVPFRHEYVHARRLATSDPESADIVAVRAVSGGSARSPAIPPVLSRMRRGSERRTCVDEFGLRCSDRRRIGRNRRGSRCPCPAFPLSNVVVLVPIIFIPLFFTIPSFIYIAIWFITQVFQGVGSTLMPEAGGIAWWAHIGGFAAGLVIGPLLCCSPRTYRPHYDDEGVMGSGPRGGRR